MRQTEIILFSAGVTLTAFSAFLLNRRLGDYIVKNAEKYLGTLEIKQNKGFYDKVFEHKLRQLGWTPGQPWCAYWVKLVLLETFAQLDLREHFEFVNKVFSGSTQVTWKRLYALHQNRFFQLVTKPKKGDVVLFRSSKNNALGHAAIVVKREGKLYKTIEGNLNNKVKYNLRPLVLMDGTHFLLGFVRFKR